MYVLLFVLVANLERDKHIDDVFCKKSYKKIEIIYCTALSSQWQRGEGDCEAEETVFSEKPILASRCKKIKKNNSCLGGNCDEV